MALKTRPCTRCDGGGLVANTDTREPWSAWTSLPPGSDIAVKLGLVRPIKCDVCHGDGDLPIEPDPKDVLALPLDPSNDSGADTVRGYLMALLAAVWVEGEGFSGKRPFGNSGWDYDLYRPLVKAGFITGQLDEDGCLEDCDSEAGERVITAAIRSLLEVPAPHAVPEASVPVRDALAVAIGEWAKNPERRGVVDLGDLLSTAVMPVVETALAAAVSADAPKDDDR